MLTEKVIKTIKENNLIEKNDRIIIAFSAGPDSVFLLDCLNKIKEEFNLTICIAHINHNIRKRAEKDAEFAKNIASGMGLAFYLKNADVPAFSRKNKLSIEESARILRKKLLLEIFKKTRSTKIAEGHNLDDLAETVLMRILRGTGIAGLRSIPVKNLPVIRPLLFTPKKEILEYMKKNKMKYAVDETNFKNDYTRNKIRNILIPSLEKNYNPSLKKALYRLSASSIQDDDFMEINARKVYDKYICVSENKINIKKSAFLELHPSILKRIISMSINSLTGTLSDISWIHYEKLLKLIEYTGTKKISLPLGLTAVCDQNNYMIALNIKPVKNKFKIKTRKLIINGITKIEELKCHFISKVASAVPDDLITDKDTIFIDMKQITGPIIIRQRKDRDSFRPFGSKGSVKLKKFFINNKVSMHNKERTPILTNNNRIVWVCGMRMDESFRVNKDTEKILFVKYIKE